jgi:hypothetical protein
MLRNFTALCLFLALAASAFAADTAAPAARLTAEQIVERNVAARGGLSAWRSVQTMTMEGKMGAGGNQRATLPIPIPGQVGRRNGSRVLPQRPAEEAMLPFRMELKRPRKTRLEIQFRGQTAVQAYDGVSGWKLRPFLNRNEAEPFTDDELKLAATQQEIDGPLMDHAAKGIRVELLGAEKVEGRDAYKLKLTLSGGRTTHLWIDAVTFLEAKIEGPPRTLDGLQHPVEIYYKDYRNVSGLQLPYLLETHVLAPDTPGRKLASPPVPPEKIVVEKIMINPRLDDVLFTRAGLVVPAPTPASAPAPAR